LARLLVIDDEKAILDLVKNSLEKDGHIVTVCESVADVTINALKNYDLILLDIMMPEKDGIETLEEIRKNSKMVNKKRTGFSKIIMD